MVSDGHDPEHERTDAERGLLAAAATGAPLDAAERADLEALLAHDPGAAAELTELRAVLAQLEPLRGLHDPAARWEEDADPALRERVLAATSGAGTSGADAPPAAVQVPRQREHHRGRVARYALAACALLLVGGLGGALLRGGADDGSPATASGPPGTLGAREQVSVQTTSSGVTATAAVVAHTWGTEALLDVSGLPAGRTYQVVVVDEDGDAVVAGSFIGAQKPVECAMNAAVLRQDASRVEVLDPTGAPVVSAELPATA